jgi:predicted secreted hydrolase
MDRTATRRRLIAALAALPAASGRGQAQTAASTAPSAAAQPAAQPAPSSGTPLPGRPDYPMVRRGVPLAFPRDFGAHPDYRTEWWYVTGWLQPRGADPRTASSPLGFQVTFFRSRPQVDRRNPSRFAARELVLAHVALSDPRQRTLLHDQRTARAGFGLAGSSTRDTDVWIDDWRLSREAIAGSRDGTAGSRYLASITGSRIGLALQLDSTQPLLLQGDAGFSRKGPLERQASYYYTQPQLAVTGRVVRDSAALEVTGHAWLDHEWSSEILAEGATGWDWIGINLEDGGALMAFRVRDSGGSTVYAGGTSRTGGPAARRRTFDAKSVRFEPLRTWRSARTGASWPVAMRVTVGIGGERPLVVELEPMFDDQELDARTSTGIVYWEGAVTARSEGRVIGRGYLELTGYHGTVVL